MAVELATAYVSIVADTKGLADSITKGTSGLGAQANKRGSSIGGALVKGIGGAAVAGAAVVAAGAVATVGTALVKGFGRLNSLEQATAKLEGLGHSAEGVKQIMDDSLAAVRGTAFGMDEAAATAASAVAAGVKPGADLQRTLSLVADASTIAGTSMGDMGAIFNKVAGTGKIQGEVIAQLGERGIPILQLLAEEMGVSAEEVGKLASAGEIDFARFQNAMESGMGGAALKSGDTFQGAMANMQASLGRMGANFLGPVFEELAPTITAITDAMGPLEGVAAGLGEKFGDFLVPILETFRDMLDGGFDFGPFLELAGYLSPIGLAFKVLQPILPEIFTMLGQVAGIIGGALGTVLQAIMPVLSEILGAFTQLIADLLPPLMPLFTLLATVVGDLLVALLPLILPLLDIVVLILPELAKLFGFLIPIIVQVVEAISSLLLPVIDILVAYLGGMITFLTGVFTGDWEKAWDGIVQIFTGLWEGLGTIFMTIVNGWIDVLNGFLGGLNEAGNFISDITGGAINVSIPMLPHLADGATILPRRGGTLAVLAEAGRAESVVDTGLLNRALEQGISGSGTSGSGIHQVNHFAYMPPEVAVEATGQRLSSLARRARA